MNTISMKSSKELYSSHNAQLTFRANYHVH